jgi:hypothetical protein
MSLPTKTKSILNKHRAVNHSFWKLMPQTIEKTDVTQDGRSFMREKLLRIAKEPLLHFVIIGAATYLLFGLFGQSILRFREMFQQRMKRHPDNGY